MFYLEIRITSRESARERQGEGDAGRRKGMASMEMTRMAQALVKSKREEEK